MQQTVSSVVTNYLLDLLPNTDFALASAYQDAREQQLNNSKLRIARLETAAILNLHYNDLIHH